MSGIVGRRAALAGEHGLPVKHGVGRERRAGVGGAEALEREVVGPARVDAVERAMGIEVLVGAEDEPVVVGVLRLVGVARRLLQAGQRIGGLERRVADVLRVRGIADVEHHVAAVPVGRQHRRDAVDLLDDHVVQERVQVVAVDIAVVVEHLLARLEQTELLVQVVLGDRLGRRRVRDVEDVEVGTGLLVVVHADEVDLGAGAPHPHRVVLMADRFVGPRRGAGAADQRAEHVGVIAGGLHERDGIAGSVTS